jgi:hypothetical protein
MLLNSSIKIKNSKALERVVDDPIYLCILVKIGMNTDTKKGEANVAFPEEYARKITALIKAGIIEELGVDCYRLVNKSIIEISAKRGARQESKVDIKEQLLSADNLVIPKGEEDYVKIAKSFQSLFYSNIKAIKGITQHIENAKFDKWVTPVRLMVERDGVKIEQLREVWGFLKSCEFWGDKIQSTKKLRQKFNTLYNQYKSDERNKKTRRGNSGNNGIGADYLKTVLRDLQD